MKPIALITGATAGFGRATAETLARNDYDVIITGRRSEKLETLEEEIRTKTGADVLSLTFDIRDQEAVNKACNQLEGKWEEVDLLVNNAGLAAGLSHIHEGLVDDWEQMIDTNIKGLLYITRQISPGMVKRGKGHIVNIGSIAGKESYEKGNVYNATKFAGYGAAPAVLSIVYGAFHLTGIRYSCMAAVVVSSLLVIRGVYVARNV